MDKPLAIVLFGDADRKGALTFAVRQARDTKSVYVLFYDYTKESWCVELYEVFNNRKHNACYEDLRYILQDGEVTKLS